MAILLVRKREQLAKLKQSMEGGGDLSKNQKAHLRGLVGKINSYKFALIQMGFGPDDAAAWAREARKTKSKGAGAAPKASKRSGIGMYGLGHSIKAWK